MNLSKIINKIFINYDKARRTNFIFISHKGLIENVNYQIVIAVTRI